MVGDRAIEGGSAAARFTSSPTGRARRAGVPRRGRHAARHKPGARLRQLEFSCSRVREQLYLRGSYLWSRLFGNYAGLSQSDENGRTSPNVGCLYDYPMTTFMDGGAAVYGRPPTDCPHQFKTSHQAPFGASGRVNHDAPRAACRSRAPDWRLSGQQPAGPGPGRMSTGRTPTFSQTDSVLQHEFRHCRQRRIQLSVNLLNLFNQIRDGSSIEQVQHVETELQPLWPASLNSCCSSRSVCENVGVRPSLMRPRYLTRRLLPG